MNLVYVEMPTDDSLTIHTLVFGCDELGVFSDVDSLDTA